MRKLGKDRACEVCGNWLECEHDDPLYKTIEKLLDREWFRGMVEDLMEERYDEEKV